MDVDARIDLLDDYERGLALEDVDAYEDALFARALAGAAPELALRDSLHATIHAMGVRGTFELFPSAAQVALLRARSDLRVAYFDLDTHHRGVVMDPSPDADVVITRVALDTTNMDRLEVELGLEGAGVLKTLPDVSFDREAGAVFFCCEGELARSVHGKPFARFWAMGPGDKRLVAEVVVTLTS